MITDHPIAFCLAFTVAVLALGVWLGLTLRSWQVRRLKAKCELYRMGAR